MKTARKAFVALLTIFACTSLSAQKYSGGMIDKVAAVVGGEMITVSDVEKEAQMMRVQGMASDKAARCEILENMMMAKIYLMQARIDSLTVNREMVEAELSARIDYYKTRLGGESQAEEYFGMPIYKLRQEWRTQLEESTLMQQEQREIASKIPEITPYDVKQYLDTVDVDMLPVIPEKYKMSQICIYPDREAAALAAKEKLLSLRERVINGEKFSTLARLYSEDMGSAVRGGELGMASKSRYWPMFSDAAMALKPGTISQIVETPDGFHIIEVIEKNGDMFNARHILLQPKYTSEDRSKAFARLDSLKALIDTTSLTFELAAQLYSQDPTTRTNGGQMADPSTGSAYFEKDQVKPQDYIAIRDLEPGQVSDPVESLDNEGRNGNLVYKIIRLDKVVPSHVATLENDYTELLSGVRNEKQQAAIREFLDKKIRTTYILIDNLYRDCEFHNTGWASHFKEY